MKCHGESTKSDGIILPVRVITFSFVKFILSWQSSTFSAEVLLEHLVSFFPVSPGNLHGANFAHSEGLPSVDSSNAASDAHEFVRSLMGLWCPTPTGLRLPELMFEDNAPPTV